MEGFQPMEVLPTDGRITFHLLEGAKFYLATLNRFDTLILVLGFLDNIVKIRIFFQLLVHCNCRFCENVAYFHKLKYYDKLIAGNIF